MQNNTLSRADLSNETGIAKNVHYGDVLIKFGDVLDVSREQLPMIKDEKILDKYKASFLQNGDVIIADTAEDTTVGKCSEIAGLRDEVVLSGLHTIPYRPVEKFATGYLGYYLNASAYHDQLIPLMQGIKVTSISKYVMQDTDIVYPKSIEEQAMIGSYFQSLDHLITLHQRKCDQTKNLKKYMLQKMFPQNGAKVPEIRFDGYTYDWEQRKFGELYSKVSEKNDLSFGADKIISVANMYFKEEVKESSDEYMRTYNVMRLGDIAFEGNKSKNYSHGRFVENTIGDGIVSHVFDVFRPTTSYDLLFWKYLINNEGVMGRIMARCTNASTMMTNLVASDFLKEKILVPSLKEQKKIGAYFDSLDHLITLHQRKCDQTKNLKKYMLQKMFPQNGAKVPEIRFDGYTYDWEQRKFGELYSKVSEKNDLSFGADKIISVANMYFKEEVKESSDEYMRTYNVMRLGDIAFEGNKSKNYSHGRFVENTIGDGIVSHVFDVFRPTTSYDLLFWKYLINNEGVMGRIMARCTNASTMMTNLVASDFLKEKILVPSLKEQKKIGAYFDSLDHLITLHQRKCDELKKMKKYMLQNMFI